MDIVLETCPAPECNLTPHDVESLPGLFAQYYAFFAPVFPRTRHAVWAEHYLRGLLSDCERKSIEPMALRMDLPIRPLQHFIGQSTWATEPLIAQHQALVGATLGEPDGALLVDECGVLKQGAESVGVAPQYCGSVGKVANSQVGVYLGYASRKGYTLLDGRLFIPPSWFDPDYSAKRAAVELPTTVTYQTKPELALELIRAAVARTTLPARWVVADALYGNSPPFRDGVAALGLWYCTAIHGDSLVWRQHPAVVDPVYHGRGRKPTGRRLRDTGNLPFRVDALLQRLPRAHWRQATIKEGSQGPLVCEVAIVRVTEARAGLPGPRVWLIIRRSLSDPTEVRYYLCHAPGSIDQAELIRVLGLRWPVELSFEQGKQEVGLDAYEVRSWQGWHHHIVLVMLAHHFLVWVRVHWQDRAPGLTINQVRLLVRSAVPLPPLDAARALDMVTYYQRRNHRAYLSHCKRKARERATLAEQEAQRRRRYPGRPPKRATTGASA